MPVLPPARLACLVVLGGLAGCEAGPKFPPACPGLALLPDAADLTRYAGTGRDLSDLVVDARITAVPATCVRDGSGKIRATLTVVMEATRGPAAPGRVVALPYLVAVTKGSAILDEQDYSLSIPFPANLDHAQPTSEPVTLLLPVTKDVSAAAYKILVGFKLDPAELSLNRARGAR